MANLSRREFLGMTAAATASFAVSSRFSPILGANDTIRVAVVGIHGRGESHIGSLQKIEGVEVAYLVDPDSRLFPGRIKQIEDRGGRAPKCVQDLREALDDDTVDAVSIASCNHQHCLQTIWACQAGKDVYVEKPLSQTVHEGRIAVEMARKYDRVVQYGTGKGAKGDVAAELARKGTYGKLLVSRGLCYKRRDSIGFKQAKTPPSEVDFNLWCGPAAKNDYHENLVHYNWHWFWEYGCGDIGNQGAHEMHAALHAIPDATLPRRVVSIGGRFGYIDQGQTANTQVAMFDYGDTKLIFEVRGLKTGDYYGQGIGNTFHFEEGVVAGDKFYPNGGKEAEPVAEVQPERVSRGGNFDEFIKAMRTREKALLDWDIETAHYSSALCHLANISQRLGTRVTFAGIPDPFQANEFGNESFDRMADHLKANGLQIERSSYRLGRELAFDPATERFIGDEQANAMLTRAPRPPFVIPDKV
jgi:predicted dehydrogenase